MRKVNKKVKKDNNVPAIQEDLIMKQGHKWAQ